MSGTNGGDSERLGLWSEAEEPIPLRAPTPVDLMANGAALQVEQAPNHPTAADFASERMLRTGARPPASGWRLALYTLTGGLVHVGPSDAELRQRDLIARVKTPIRGCRK